MKHAVILAHPNPGSFNASIANAYVEEVTNHGGTASLRNLYALNFNPCLPVEELPLTETFDVGADIREERFIVQAADVICLVYPLWLNTPPAIMKGYLERVFGYGFGYARDAGGPKPLLSGKRLISFSTSGAPEEWVRKTGSFEALRVLYDCHLAAMCGLEVVDHVHFGSIGSLTRKDVIDRHLDTVRIKVRRMMG